MLLDKHFKQLATVDEENILKKWFDASKENQQCYFELRAIREAHATITMIDTEGRKDRMLGRINARIDNNEQTLKTKKPFFQRWLRSIPSIAAIIIVFFSISRALLKDDSPTLSFVTHCNSTGNPEEIKLNDGTTVLLTANSTIYYHIDTRQRERWVKIEGEAYFDVQHTDSIP